MAKIITMTRQAGDICTEFDPSNQVALADAQKMLDECLGRGGAAFSRKAKGDDPVQVKVIDPTATETLLREQLIGG